MTKMIKGIHFYVLCHSNAAKLEIIYFLLENDAKLALENENGDNVFCNVYKNFSDQNYIETLFKKIYNKITSKPSEFSPDNFINIIVKGLFKNQNFTQFDQLKSLFGDLLELIGDINVTNTKGETVLINYVKRDYCEIDNVKFLLQNGVDADAKDNDGNNALYYALSLRNDEIFMHLLSEGVSVDRKLFLKANEQNKSSIVKILYENHYEEVYRVPDEEHLSSNTVPNRLGRYFSNLF